MTTAPLIDKDSVGLDTTAPVGGTGVPVVLPNPKKGGILNILGTADTLWVLPRVLDTLLYAGTPDLWNNPILGDNLSLWEWDL